MPYAILRTAKLKTIGNIGGSLAHNYRERETKNADPSKINENTHSLPDSESVKKAIVTRLPEKRRSDAVLCIEYMISASPEWTGWNDERQKIFFDQSIQWLENRHGKNNVVATSIHRDETTPHLVAYVVPLDEETGKLNAKKFLGGRATLSKMQTDFANTVEDLGLERGIEGSKAEHTKIKDYYARVNEPIPQLGKIAIPKPNLMDTSKKYGEKVADSVIEQIKPQYEYMATLSKEVRFAQKQALEARKSLLQLQKKVQPYLEAIKGLTALQREKLNNDIMEMSRRIQVEDIQLVEQCKKEREEHQQYQEKEKNQEWKEFFDHLTQYQQAHLDFVKTSIDRNFKDDAILHQNKIDEFQRSMMSIEGRKKLEKLDKDKQKQQNERISPQMKATINELDKNAFQTGKSQK